MFLTMMKTMMNMDLMIIPKIRMKIRIITSVKSMMEIGSKVRQNAPTIVTKSL